MARRRHQHVEPKATMNIDDLLKMDRQQLSDASVLEVIAVLYHPELSSMWNVDRYTSDGKQLLEAHNVKVKAFEERLNVVFPELVTLMDAVNKAIDSGDTDYDRFQSDFEAMPGVLRVYAWKHLSQGFELSNIDILKGMHKAFVPSVLSAVTMGEWDLYRNRRK